MRTLLSESPPQAHLFTAAITDAEQAVGGLPINGIRCGVSPVTTPAPSGADWHDPPSRRAAWLCQRLAIDVSRPA